MLSFLPSPIIAFLVAVSMVLNLCFWGFLFYVVLIFKILFWFTPLRTPVTQLLVGLADAWISGNHVIYKVFLNVTWDIDIQDSLNKKQSYLLTSNHQSWLDILVLQKAMKGRVPFLRFFLKQQLIWLPILGLAWWGLDMPFMKRFTRDYLEKNPHMKGKDVEATRRSCQQFKKNHVSIINFFEGTRFTPAKYKKQQSPFKHLLKPKAGGAAFTIQAMDGAIKQLVCCAIVYPEHKATLKDFLYNRIETIKVQAHTLDIPEEFIQGDYENDPEFKAKFQAWVNTLWASQDERITKMKETG